MVQQNPLQTQQACLFLKGKTTACRSFEAHLNATLRYLVSCSDDKHSPQEEALAVHVALVTGPPGPYEVLPHSEANEAQTPHLSRQRAIEVFLQR